MIEEIDYEALGGCMPALDITRRIFVSKWTSNTNANAKNMVEWDKQHKGSCPYYHEPKENNDLILLCQHQRAKKPWNDNMKKHRKQLNKLDTCWYVKLAIRKELKA